MSSAAAATDWGFLGEEFLTWLWYRIDTKGGDFELPGKRQVGVVLDDFLAFAPRDQDETEQTLKKGLPTHSAEAATALRNGRRLRRAKLIVAEGQASWTVTIDGPTMSLLSVRVPDDDEEATEPKDVSIERALAFWRVHEIVAGLYRHFLDVRLRPEYLKSTGEAQANWMQSRG